MGMALQIILVSVAVEFEREFCSLFGCHPAHIAHIFHPVPFGLFLPGSTSIRKALLLLVDLRIEEPVTTHQSRIKHAQRGNGFKPLIRLGSFQRIPAAATDAENTDA